MPEVPSSGSAWMHQGPLSAPVVVYCRSLTLLTQCASSLSLGKFFQIAPVYRNVLSFSIQSLKIEALIGLGHDNSDSIGGANLDGLLSIRVLQKRYHLGDGHRRRLFFFVQFGPRFHGRSLQEAAPQFAEDFVACR